MSSKPNRTIAMIAVPIVSLAICLLMIGGHAVAVEAPSESSACISPGITPTFKPFTELRSIHVHIAWPPAISSALECLRDDSCDTAPELQRNVRAYNSLPAPLRQDQLESVFIERVRATLSTLIKRAPGCQPDPVVVYGPKLNEKAQRDGTLTITAKINVGNAAHLNVATITISYFRPEAKLTSYLAQTLETKELLLDLSMSSELLTRAVQDFVDQSINFGITREQTTY